MAVAGMPRPRRALLLLVACATVVSSRHVTASHLRAQLRDSSSAGITLTSRTSGYGSIRQASGLEETPHSEHGHEEHRGSQDNAAPHDSHHAPGAAHGDPHINDGARAVAVGLVFTSAMVPIVMYMALIDGLVSQLTLRMLDTFVSIFIAVVWFNAFAQLLITFRIGERLPYGVEVCSLLQAVVLYYITMRLAWAWKDNTKRLAAFCSCGAHMIAFAFILGFGTAQGSTSDHLPDHAVRDGVDVACSFTFCAVVVVVLATISVLTWYGWRKQVEHEKFNETFDDLEFDILGLVLSFLVTQAVRHALTGRVPPLHFLLQTSQESAHPIPTGFTVSDRDHYVHTAGQRNFMLMWSIGISFVTWLSLMPLSLYQVNPSTGYWGKRTAHVVKVLLVMMSAWGFLLWSQWQFHENLFKGDEMFGQLVFASCATLICLIFLVIVAHVQSQNQRSLAVLQTNEVTATGVSLIAAWSWEHCFNSALTVIGHDFQVGYGGLVPKVCLAVLIPAVLLPTYINHLKPRVLDFMESVDDLQAELGSEELAKRSISPSDTRCSSEADRRSERRQSPPAGA